jgi:hypothetical protein
MTVYNITEVPQSTTAPAIRNDIPVFIGKSSILNHKSISFINGDYTKATLSLDVSVQQFNENFVISYWRDLVTPFNATTLVNGQTLISVNATVVANLDATKLIFALIDNSGTLLFTSPVSNIVFSPDNTKVLSVIIKDPLVVSTQTKGSILGIAQESIPYTYSMITKVYTLNYTPLSSVTGLSVVTSKSYVEYETLNTSDYSVITDESVITESNQDILRGLNASEQAVVIPAYSDADISNVINILNILTPGYYITPIGMSDTFNLAIANYVKSITKSKPYSAVLPPAAIVTQNTLVSGATYVKS